MYLNLNHNLAARFSQSRDVPKKAFVASMTHSSFPFPPGSLHSLSTIFFWSTLNPSVMEQANKTFSITIQPLGQLMVSSVPSHSSLVMRRPSGSHTGSDDISGGVVDI